MGIRIRPALAVLLAACLLFPACGESDEGDKKEPSAEPPVTRPDPGPAPGPDTDTEPPPVEVRPDIPKPGPGPEAGPGTVPGPTGPRGIGAMLASLDVAGLKEYVAENGADGIRALARQVLPTTVRKLVETSGRAEALKLLLDPPLAPAVRPDEEQAAVLEAAWRQCDLRRDAEAEEALAKLDVPLGEIWLVRARMAKTDGEFGTCLGRAIAEGSRKALRLLAAGVMLAEAGEHVLAAKSVADSGAEMSLAPRVLIRLLSGEGVEAARADCDAAAEAAPDDPDLLILRAGFHLLAGEVEGAEKLLAPMVAAESTDQRVWEVEAAHRTLQRNPEGALAAFGKVLDQDPGAVQVRRNMAHLLCILGKPDEAAAQLDAIEAASGTPRLPRIWDALSNEFGASRLYGTDVALAIRFLDLAIRSPEGMKDPARVERLIERSVRIKPSFAAGWVALSEVRLRQSGLTAAVETLRAGAKPISTEDARWWLLLRLAVRLLQSGDREGYTEFAGGVPAASTAGRILAKLGEPSESGVVLVENWARCRIAPGGDRFAAVAEAFLGTGDGVIDRLTLRSAIRKAKATVVTGANFDPRPLLDAGRPFLFERMVPGERIPMPEMVLVVGYDSGLGAYLVDEPSPWGAALITQKDLEGGILFVLPDESGLPRAEPEAVAIADSLYFRNEGKFKEADARVPADSKSLLGVFLKTWAALLRKDMDKAAAILAEAIEADPDEPCLRLILAETRLLTGDVGLAVQAVKGLDYLTNSLLVRRIKGLGQMESGEEEAGISTLRKILEQDPSYFQVYTDLSDHLLPRGRFKEGIEILHGLGLRQPALLGERIYQSVLNQAYSGLVRAAVSAEDLMPLLRSPYADVRRAAVRAGAGLPYVEALKILPRLAVDRDATVRATTVRFLGERDFKDGAETVLGCFDDEDPRVRGAAARALRQLRGMEAVRSLVGLLRDADAYVREVAVAELRTLSGKEFGFDPRGTEEVRESVVTRWEAWAGDR